MSRFRDVYILLAVIFWAFIACENLTDIIEDNDSPELVHKIELSQKSIEVDVLSSEYSVSISSTCSWEAKCKDDWIILETQRGDEGVRELIFSVIHNEDIKARNGVIVIHNEKNNLFSELHIYQKEFAPTINISPELLLFAYSGGTQKISIESNFEYVIRNDCEWISYEETESGINVFVDSSTKESKRIGEVFISNEKYNISKSVKIEQSAFIPQIDIYPESLIFSPQGGSQEVEIEANIQYKVSSNSDWLSLSQIENRIIVEVSAYDETSRRDAQITISNEDYRIVKGIEVSQSALNVIRYTSSDGKIILPNTSNDPFGANIVSNTYENGIGIILFDDSLNAVGRFAFEDCSRLTNIIIPEGVLSIGDSAFEGCVNLTSISIPNNVSSIGYWAFCGCSIKDIVLPKRLIEIKGCTFKDCHDLTDIVIPNSVSKIGESAFENCTSLKEIVIPNEVHSIEQCAFRNCTNLTNASILEGTKSIGDRVFEHCQSLTSVSIPNSVIEMGELAFCDCSKLERIDISDLSSWCRIKFINYSTTNPLSNKANLYVCGELLVDLVVPTDITILGFSTFSGCQSIKSVTIPNNVVEIGQNTFYGCSNLISVEGGENVKSIGPNAFRECENLQKAEIGSCVEQIHNETFYGCINLQTLYCKPTIPPAISNNPFPFNSGMKIFVPRNSYYSYTQYSSPSIGTLQTNWCNYNSYIEPYDF